LGRHDDAFEETVRMHGPAVFALIVRFVRDRGTAEDLWQETFFAAAEAARKGEIAATPGAWLRTVATRKVVDHVRRAAARPSLNGGLEPAARQASETSRPTADFEDELATLPLVERAVVLLAYQEGRALSEIAALLDAPVGTVKTWLFRARNRLRPRFEEDRR
jgi:RNA polymerase sigma-70 factor, ECF subfamily